jgi:uncharacterized membrane protein
MFAFLNLGAEATTILLFFGWLVIMPLIVGIVAFAIDQRAKRPNAPI